MKAAAPRTSARAWPYVVVTAAALVAAGCRSRQAGGGGDGGDSRADGSPPQPAQGAPAGVQATPFGAGALLRGWIVPVEASGGARGAGLGVVIVDVGSGRTFDDVRVDGAGWFHVALAPGRYELTARAAGNPASRGDSQVIDVLDRQSAVLALTPGLSRAGAPDAATSAAATPPVVAAASLEVTLLGPTGKPASGAWVWASVTPPARDGARHHQQARADAAGIARFSSLPPGTVTVGADHPTAGFIDARPVERAAMPAPTSTRLTLTMGGSLQGHVQDIDGRPVAGIPVSLTGAPVPIDGGPDFVPARHQVTDETGAFRIHGLRRGRFRLEAGWVTETPPARYRFGARPNPVRMGSPPRPTPLALRAPDVLEVDAVPGQHMGGLTLLHAVPDGVIAGRVTAGGHAVAGALVEAFLAPRPDRSAPSAGRVSAALTDAKGSFRLLRLLRDRKFRIVVTFPGAEARHASLDAVAEGTMNAEIGG